MDDRRTGVAQLRQWVRLSDDPPHPLVIAWYAHHQGAGHVTRATTVAALMSTEVVILSSAVRPADWPADRWVELPDDSAPGGRDHTAGGVLHWAPLGHAAYRDRMERIAAWVQLHRPALVVSDVSVEVALLVRLLGVPVVLTVMAGDRSDRPHVAAYDAATALIAAWPAEVGGRLVTGWTSGWEAKATFVGAFSRFDGRSTQPPTRQRRVAVLWGHGGDRGMLPDIAAARAATPQWAWTVCEGTSSQEEVWQQLQSADVVVLHGGQNAIAEVAAARRPAIVLPQVRPHEEQVHLAHALEGLGLAHPRPSWPPAADWPELLTAAAATDPSLWSRWADGSGAQRYAARLDALAGGAP